MSEQNGPPAPILGSSEGEDILPPPRIGGSGGPLSNMPPVPPRRKASPAKKSILLGVWIVLLGGLLYGVTHFGNGNTANPNLPPPGAPRYFPDPAKMAAAWPAIVQHAAAPPRGPAHAPYTLAEFGDFQCPQCGKAYPVVEKLLVQNPTQVNLLFVHRPFPKDSQGNVMHQWAIPSAVAADAAAQQGKFWPMYDYLYTHQDDLEPGFYPQYAENAGDGCEQVQCRQRVACHYAAGDGNAELHAGAWHY